MLKETMSKNLRMIDYDNLSFYKAFNAVMFAVCSVLILTNVFKKSFITATSTYVICLTTCIIALILTKTVFGKHPQYIVYAVYFTFFKMYALSIFSSAVFSKSNLTVVFFIFLIVLPVCFVIRTQATVAIQLLATAVFCVFTYKSKAPELAYKDIFTAIIIMSVSLIIAHKIRNIRINHIETVTRQKETEKQLKKQRDEYTQLINIIPCGIGKYLLDEKFTPLFTSPFVYKISGFDRDEYKLMCDNSTLNAVFIDDRKKLKEEIYSAERENRNIDISFRLIVKDSDCLWMHIRGAILTDGDNKIILITFSDIDELVRSSLALSEVNKKLEIAMNSSDVAMWTFNIAEGKFESANNTSRKFGFAENQYLTLQSMMDAGYIMPDSRIIFKDMHDRLNAGEPEVAAIIHLNNEILNIEWEQIKYTTIFDENGKPISAVGSGRDMSKLKALETRYDRELSYQSIMLENTVSNHILNLTQNTIISLRSGFNAEKDVSQAKTADEFFSIIYDNMPEHEQKTDFMQRFNRKSLMRSFTMGQTRVRVEHKYCGNGDKPATWLLSVASILRNPETNDIEAFIYASDIQQKKILELIVDKTIATDYEFFATIDTKLGEVYIRHGVDDSLPYISYDSHLYDECVNIGCSNWIIEDERETAKKELKLSAITENLKHSNYYICNFTVHDFSTGKPKRKKWAFSYLDNEKTTIIYTRSDVSEIYFDRQKTLEKLSAAREEAERANESKTDFLSRMSHDMRTPLNAILGLSQMAISDDMQKAELCDYMHKINTSGEYLLGLINDILDLSKIESAKVSLNPEPYSTKQCLDEILIIMQPLINKKKLHFTYSESNFDTLPIMVDRLRYKQIWINLFSNAVKYTPDGGNISISSKLVGRDEKSIHCSYTIRDTGKGMSEQFQKHMFEPFTQERSKHGEYYGGTGLGLAIVKNLTDLMNGEISVESSPGEGSAFTIRFKFEFASSPSNQGSAEDDYDFSDKEILIAEDHPINAMIVSKMLTSKGAHVLVAENGRQTVEIFKNSPVDTYAAILMDIRMPVLDGNDATVEIRNLERDDAKTIPIIAMTANDSEDDKTHAFNVGMNSHLSKPIVPKRLFETLNEYI